MKEAWYKFTSEEVLRELNSGIKGLSGAEAESRLKKYGYNEIKEKKDLSPILLFFKQFKSLLVIILLVASLISYLTGHIIDVYVILAVVFLNSIIGFVQEYKADKAVESLKKMVRHTAKVFRNGEMEEISALGIVPGDILLLNEGDIIPADARLIYAKDLKCVESSLTGESVPVGKHTSSLPADAPLADRKNMVYKGTFIASGYARAVVTTTGMNTALGEIAESLTRIKAEKSNFQKKTDYLAKQMAILAFSSASLLFIVGYFIRNFDPAELLIVSIAALISAIPEGLPAVLSIVLAIGAKRMSKRKAIIREFTATETLGSVTTIITDKTGTLTQNTLTVRNIFIPGESEISVTGEGWLPYGDLIKEDVIINQKRSNALDKLLKIAAYSNNSCIDHDLETDTYKILGDPTEGAILVLANKTGVNISFEEAEDKKLDDMPFNSELKLRATLVKGETSNENFIVGAPEILLNRSQKVLSGTNEIELTDVIKKNIENVINKWGYRAIRVVAFAYKRIDKETCKINDDTLKDLVFSGLVGMIDPPRTGVKESVEDCKKAGIRVIMATGDHINTAIAIARSVSILDEKSNEKTQALTESHLKDLNEREFDKAIREASVLARLTPGMKLKIAARLQSMGELIAMTGDGVNDAPALKKADVGVAMGIMGTDVARDASKVVLADDKFSTIVNAIEEGRIVFTNSRQTSFYLVTTNFAEILTLVSIISLGFPLPLTATQILWLNLVTDGCLVIPLAAEQGHGDVLEDKPVSKKENILNKKVTPFLLINAIIMTALSIIFFFIYIPEGIQKARTTVFMIMAFTQIMNVFNMRSLKKSIFQIGIFSNKWILAGFFASLFIQYLIINLPFFQGLFSFSDISYFEFGIIFLTSSLVLWTGELYKFVTRKKMGK